MKVEIETKSSSETKRVGKVLGLHSQPGDLILLVGELGSGKTTLTQGIGLGLKVQGIVRSPTFVLVTQHHGRTPLFHVDLYRIGGLEEFLDLGLDDETLGMGLAVVEWADRAIEAFPSEHLVVRMESLGESQRALCLEAYDRRHVELLGALKQFKPKG
jgi:tRNA threonylcarbamoyladenosine biosynthesis protein TsaE